MTESAQSPEDAAAARAAEQARLRKERREAKIKAGAASRLNKITGLGGGIQRAPPPSQSPSSTPPSSQPSAPAAAAQTHEDPEEVDISTHYYEPRATARQPLPADPSSISETQLRQMMLGLDNPAQNPFAGLGLGPGADGQRPLPAPPGMEGMEEDPMMKMLSQMMAGGGMPGAPGGANPFAGAGMENFFGGGGGGAGAGMPPAQPAAAADKTANLWRVLHAVFALGLGLYVALTTTFTGARAEREDPAAAGAAEARAYFFYLFTSVEAVLLTTRYFLEQSRPPPSGVLWSLSGFLPGPAQAYLRHGLRYFQIFSTVRGDALVCVFVLGVCCWLRS